MARVLLILVWIALTVYAVADWARTPEDNMPARFPRAVWLLLILLTIPSFSIGAVAWVIMRWVQRKEGDASPTPGSPLFGGVGSRLGGVFGGSSRDSQHHQAQPLAPDDDPDYLFKLERDIQRRKRQADAENLKKRNTDQPSGSASSAQGADRPSGAASPLPDSGSDTDRPDSASDDISDADPDQR